MNDEIEYRLVFDNDSALFSPVGVDRGTQAMLDAITFQKEDKLLDLGCGWGAVGLLAARYMDPSRIVMTDIDPTAVKNARKNAALNHVEGLRIVCGDAFDAVEDKDFTLILSNPPYHEDFSVAKRFIEKGFNRLATGGKMVMVTKRKEWYKNKFISIFGGVRITEQDGYYVFQAEKRSRSHANSERKRNE